MGSKAKKSTTTTKRKSSSRKPLAGLRTTKRATPGKPASKVASQPATLPPPLAADTPGLRTRADGRQTRRTTIYMDPAMAERLNRASFETRKTMSELVCAELEAKYGAKPTTRKAS